MLYASLFNLLHSPQVQHWLHLLLVRFKLILCAYILRVPLALGALFLSEATGSLALFVGTYYHNLLLFFFCVSFPILLTFAVNRAWNKSQNYYLFLSPTSCRSAVYKFCTSFDFDAKWKKWKQVDYLCETSSTQPFTCMKQRFDFALLEQRSIQSSQTLRCCCIGLVLRSHRMSIEFKKRCV